MIEFVVQDKKELIAAFQCVDVPDYYQITVLLEGKSPMIIRLDYRTPRHNEFTIAHRRKKIIANIRKQKAGIWA